MVQKEGQKRLTSKERRDVSAVLKAGLDEGITLDSRETVQKYLEGGTISPELLRTCSDHIFDCYIRLLFAERNRQRHSPPFTDRSQSSRSNSSQAGDGRPDSNEPEPFSFVSEERSKTITCYGRANEFETLTMRPCKGKLSYISEDFARKQLGTWPKRSVILQWAPLGGGGNISRTRCAVTDRKHLPRCDLALAEEHGKDDFDTGEDEAWMEQLKEHRSMEASGSPEAAPSPEFDGEEGPGALAIATAARLIVQASREFEKLAKPKRKSTSSASSVCSERQHKRRRNT